MADNANTMSSTYRCRVDGAPCGVVAIFASALLRELVANAVGDGLEGDRLGEVVRECFSHTMRIVAPMLPCGRCRAGEAALARLPRTRLGRLERRALLQARPPDDLFGVVEAEAGGRASREAHCRAIRRLKEHGLLETDKRDCRDRDGYATDLGSRLVVRRTPLGQAIVDKLGGELREGERIRWEKHMAALRTLLVREPSELLKELAARSRQTSQTWADLAEQVAGIGMPDLPNAQDNSAALSAALSAMESTLVSRTGA